MNREKYFENHLLIYYHKVTNQRDLDLSVLAFFKLLLTPGYDLSHGAEKSARSGDYHRDFVSRRSKWAYSEANKLVSM